MGADSDGESDDPSKEEEKKVDLGPAIDPEPIVEYSKIEKEEAEVELPADVPDLPEPKMKEKKESFKGYMNKSANEEEEVK